MSSSICRGKVKSRFEKTLSDTCRRNRIGGLLLALLSWVYRGDGHIPAGVKVNVFEASSKINSKTKASTFQAGGETVSTVSFKSKRRRGTYPLNINIVL
jgi:hypothetical protein